MAAQVRDSTKRHARPLLPCLVEDPRMGRTAANRPTRATPEQRVLAARIGAKSRHHPDSDLDADRRDLRAAKIEAAIAAAIAARPPLTRVQRDHLALLLHSGGDGGS